MREDSAMDRKKRSRNFSNRDRFLLTDVMKTEVKVIESKRHDGRSNDARKQAWKNVVNAFNARTDEKREEKQLAQLWRDMKRNCQEGSFTVQAAAHGHWRWTRACFHLIITANRLWMVALC